MFSEDQEDSDVWINIADIMSGMMLVFLGIAIFFMVDINQQKKELEKQNDFVQQIVHEYKNIRKELYLELKETFEGRFQEWGADINEETLSIRFVEQSCMEDYDADESVLPKIFFAQNSSSLTDFGKEVVEEFFPIYIEILSQSKFKKHILEIRIEGHTSKEWSKNTSEDKSYLYNLKLSQSRSRSVVKYITKIKEDHLSLDTNWDWMKSSLTANGLSSSKLIFDSSGQENPDCSRRVEFRVVTDAEKQINILLEKE